MFARSILAVVVLIVLLGNAHPSQGDEPLPPPFITSLETHRLFDGKLTIHMLEEDGFVIYKFEQAAKKLKTDTVNGTSQVTASPTKPRIKVGAKWFVYPVSADEVWIYEGGDDLTLYTAVSPETRRPLNNGVFIMADKEHNILKKAPRIVLDRLPKSIKEKYGVDRADDKPIKGDLAKLQGVWKGKTGRNGIFESVMTIKGEDGQWDNSTADGRAIGLSYKLKIDEEAKPHKTIDVSDILRYGGTGDAPEHVFGIYEFIDENTIRICNGFEKHPTEFKAGDNGPPMLCILKRVIEDARPAK